MPALSGSQKIRHACPYSLTASPSVLRTWSLPCSPATLSLPLTPRGLGPLSSRLLSGLHPSVMKLGGGGRRLRMRKWKPNMRATEKSGPQTSMFQQHTPWGRNMQAARGACSAGPRPTCAKVRYRASRHSACTGFLYIRCSVQSSPQPCEVGVIIPMSQAKTQAQRH